MDQNIQNLIRYKFTSIQNIEDLANLLNFVYEKKFPRRSKSTIIKILPKDLNYYAFEKSKNHYKTFHIKKKSGGTRVISSPSYKLKTIQKCINEVLHSVFTPHRNAYGFVPGKNIRDNATPHISKLFVYNIDLENFFPSISFRRVKSVLNLSPFNLNDSDVQNIKREHLAFLIANLCCNKGFLPQGAPTSPTLTNIVCQRLDKKLTRLARDNNAAYTRYADDITFSSYKMAFNLDFKATLAGIIEKEENFKINYQKERLQSYRERQMVTGLVVNVKTNVTRQYVKDIRFWLMCWEKYGTEATQLKFILEFKNKKSFTKYKGTAPKFYHYLQGKILYFGMVRGTSDSMHFKFQEKLDTLLKANSLKSDNNKINDLLNILLEWENAGIDKVMEKY